MAVTPAHSSYGALSPALSPISSTSPALQQSFLPLPFCNAWLVSEGWQSIFEYLGSMREVHSFGQIGAIEFEREIAMWSELLLFACN
jgi:hypothetical protein